VTLLDRCRQGRPRHAPGRTTGSGDPGRRWRSPRLVAHGVRRQNDRTCVQPDGRDEYAAGRKPSVPAPRGQGQGGRTGHRLGTDAPRPRDDGAVAERNVLGADLEPCGTDPLTGFFRDGSCRTGPEDLGSHTICAVVTAEFLDHQRSIGNDLTTPRPQYRFPGLVPGDRWCVTAVNWARAYDDGLAAPVILASTNEAVLQIVPMAMLREHAVDVPDDPSTL